MPRVVSNRRLSPQLARAHSTVRRLAAVDVPTRELRREVVTRALRACAVDDTAFGDIAAQLPAWLEHEHLNPCAVDVLEHWAGQGIATPALDESFDLLSEAQQARVANAYVPWLLGAGPLRTSPHAVLRATFWLLRSPAYANERWEIFERLLTTYGYAMHAPELEALLEVFAREPLSQAELDYVRAVAARTGMELRHVRTVDADRFEPTALLRRKWRTRRLLTMMLIGSALVGLWMFAASLV